VLVCIENVVGYEVVVDFTRNYFLQYFAQNTSKRNRPVIIIIITTILKHLPHC